MYGVCTRWNNNNIFVIFVQLKTPPVGLRSGIIRLSANKLKFSWAVSRIIRAYHAPGNKSLEGIIATRVIIFIYWYRKILKIGYRVSVRFIVESWKYCLNKIRVRNRTRPPRIFRGQRPALLREVRESDGEASSKLEWGEGEVEGAPGWGGRAPHPPQSEQWPGGARSAGAVLPSAPISK